MKKLIFPQSFRQRILAGVIITLTASQSIAAPPELEVVGNHLENKSTGAVVRLTGANLPSLQWGAGENLANSMTHMTNVWKCNAIRLNLNQASWLAGGTYQATVDAMVNQASAANVYIILDNHGYVQPDNNSIAFWTSVANRPLYKNNPAVLFGLLNEPHGTTWDVWKNGDANGPGLQAVINAIRATGANNLLVIGGLGYASDLRGVLTGGYALTDTVAGNGIVYDQHLYPWHTWAGFAAAAQTYPILLGECGHDGSDTGGTGQTFGANSPMAYWKLLNMADAMGMNYTAWAFHPAGGPPLITEWNGVYTPTSSAGEFVYDHLLSLRDSAHESTVLNPGFEVPVTSSFVYRPAGATWTFAGNAGIQNTWNTARQGAQTAFLQTATATDAGQNGVDGSMSQTFNFDTPGTYIIGLQLAQRSGKTALPIKVSVDGVPISSVEYTPTDVVGDNFFTPVATAAFTINSPGNHTIKLEATASPGVNKEALVDNVIVTSTPSGWIPNHGFAAPALANGAFSYRPSGSAVKWTFAGNAGVEYNALGATTAPEGRYPQAAFLQTAAAVDAGENNIDGSITQSIEFAAPGAYALTFKAASRAGKGNLGIRVLIDGVLAGTVTPVSTTWATFNSPSFNIVTPGYHTVQLAATPSATVDNEAFIDAIQITVPSTSFAKPTPLVIGNAGFESPSPMTNKLVYQQSGYSWTFTGGVPGAYLAGIQSVTSTYVNGDARQPTEGWQSAFMTGNGTIGGTISQAINFPSAGSYAIGFQAQRGRNGGNQITVDVDGTVVGTHMPAHKAFYPYTTAPFTVTAGIHTIRFTADATNGDSKWTLIDEVNVWPIDVSGGNHALNKTVTASSSHEASGWGAAKAVDGQKGSISTSRGWTSSSTLTANHTEWVQVDFGAAANISEADLFPRNDGVNLGYGFPINFTIQVSDDATFATGVTTVVTRTNYPKPATGVGESFTFPAVSARYMRITGTSLRANPNDSNYYRMQFAEVEVY